MRTSRWEQTERARDEGCDCSLRCATGLPRPEIDHYGLPGPRPRHQTAAPGQRGVAFVLGWLGVGVLGSGCGCAGQWVWVCWAVGGDELGSGGLRVKALLSALKGSVL